MVIEDKLMGKDLKAVIGKTRKKQSTTMENPEEMRVEEDSARESRGHWKHPLDFLFSCISVSVGLGNIWRFPYLCYKNGGGVFLIIYFISMAFCGIPVFLLEVSLGQYLGAGGMTTIAQICPILKGVGIATMVMVTYYNIYYCVIVAWSLYYFVASFVAIPDLPWNTCDGYWNTDDCWMPIEDENGTVLNPLANGTNSTAPVEEFWDHRVLQINGGIEYGLGSLQWEMSCALLGGWLLVYLIVWRGLHQSGYIIWFTALFPYTVMSVLLIRAVTLPGAVDGLLAYIDIDWTYMKKGSTWIDAATQIFFAYSVGVGALPALGSYNRFNHNCFRDAVITCIVNTCTCLTAGVLVFSCLGYMAHLQGVTVHDVARSGPGLVFLTYPELVLSLPGSFIWAILFFAMLLVLGVDTEFCSVESLITGIVDNWSDKLLPHRKKVALAICVSLFLAGLTMCTNGGIYLFQIMDFYSASGLSLLWICFFETIAVSWFYGASRFSKNIEEMLGYKPWAFWHYCWLVFAPAVMGGVFVYYIYSYEAVTFGEDYKYPKWAEVLGLCISFSSMIWVILYAIYWMITTPGTLKERWIQGVTPVFDQQQNNTSRSVNNAENLPAEENRLVNGEEETEVEETKNDNLA